ncbi:hypothetical protein DCS_01047 [Drechmeria coniospora]|uniref:Uncharacterized protein n=1 Tax=Drechmeria coniospora TaxID=98403 RepID=A0A151GS64_DRECN|nr:hypothetical protein DCS_01047 [Drechmeria coniospora]KYK59913.1 hypothetical protein DCS_01047 [Drechmeria coniospora]
MQITHNNTHTHARKSRTTNMHNARTHARTHALTHSYWIHQLHVITVHKTRPFTIPVPPSSHGRESAGTEPPPIVPPPIVPDERMRLAQSDRIAWSPHPSARPPHRSVDRPPLEQAVLRHFHATSREQTPTCV